MTDRGAEQTVRHIEHTVFPPLTTLFSLKHGYFSLMPVYSLTMNPGLATPQTKPD